MRLLRALPSLAALLAFVAFAAAGTPTGAAAGTPIPPAPAAWVTDTAGFLSAGTVRTLDARLRAYEQQTGHQVIVYIAPTTGGAPLEDWTVRAFKQWKVGRKGLDDGAVLFVFSQDRKLRIEVGYGLEATLTDAQASRIIREAIEPELRAGRPDAAVTAGVDRLLQTIGGEAAPAAAAATEIDPVVIIVIALVLFGLLILAVRSPWTALWLLSNIFSSQSRGGYRGGGSSNGGGGFSGGGGRSGGGGASGSW
jgi:uncharacterized protein